VPAPRIVLVDGTNSLYRAFFAPMADLRATDGTPTKAVLVFTNMLLKTLREEKPDYCVVVFDARGKTLRHETFADYKAGRDSQPEDLSVQIPLAREIVEALALPIVEVPRYEADDVIATLVTAAPADAHIAIVSTDRDLMQLVDDRVHLLDGIRDRRYDPAAVEARFGVPPAQVLDLRALVGDKSDNIPGVKGIGEKGAAELIRQWGDLETVLAHAGEVKAKRAREALLAQLDAARLSKQLASLHRDVPVDCDFEHYRRREPDRDRLREIYRRFEFVRLLESLDAEAPPPAQPPTTPAAVSVETVSVATGAAQIAARLATLESVAVVCVDSGGTAVSARPLGVALGLSDASAVWIPTGAVGAVGADGEALGSALRSILSGDVAWVGADTKRVQTLFAEAGIALPRPAFDVSLAGQLLDATGATGVAALAAQCLGRSVRRWEELAGRGGKALRAEEISAADLAAWAGEQAAAVHALHVPLQERLQAQGLTRLYEDVELPLTAVVSGMERAGVRVDEEVLARLSHEYVGQLASIEKQIYALAGEQFLISSPKQLQRILFEKLKLPVIRKTKTGYSTDEGVLEQLAAKHELPERILAHRRLAKLVSTYVNALPPLVDPSTGRIHPTYHQIGAATGRLSATNPNVQNIPIRSAEGGRIREAFIAAEGCVLASADYSQVELRILAHFSQDERLREAFRSGDDIHRETAAEVWSVAPEDVTPDQRARAKAVNFGIIYGLSSFGLANQLGIATAEAQETIETYFARYPGVRRFIDETIETAKREGAVRTLLGRRRALPDLASRNRVLRQAAERMAVNTVVQGTAADLIKCAMLAVDEVLHRMRSAARLILQVHDELVLELPVSEVESVVGRVREVMEGVMSLGVPLRVDIGVGRNWREAH
jgi:DNA polymerase-1